MHALRKRSSRLIFPQISSCQHSVQVNSKSLNVILLCLHFLAKIFFQIIELHVCACIFVDTMTNQGITYSKHPSSSVKEQEKRKEKQQQQKWKEKRLTYVRLLDLVRWRVSIHQYRQIIFMPVLIDKLARALVLQSFLSLLPFATPNFTGNRVSNTQLLPLN